MKKYSFLIVFFTAITVFSQNYEGSFTETKEKGLHQIRLTPEIRSACTDNFSFIRIYNTQKKQIPYTLFYSKDRTFSKYLPAKIVSKRTIRKVKTSLIIENKDAKNQDYIVLKTANTAITKWYNVFGSNDSKQWFGLVSDEVLRSTNSATKTTVENTIPFPLNNYKFLRIDFLDKNSSRINILSAGRYESQVFSQEPTVLNDFKYEITSLKDQKVTQITFSAKAAYEINSISFDINTAYYLRNAKLIVKRTRKIKKRTETSDEVLYNFELNSKNKNSFSFNNLNEKEFIIEINNEDNPSLDITKIQLSQNPIYLVSNFEKNTTYKMEIDSTLSKPSYDLGNFISSETENIQEITLSKFSKIDKQKEVQIELPFWQTSIFMWGCIVLSGIIIVYFALGLLKDITKEEK